jgi:hypothetical protein
MRVVIFVVHTMGKRQGTDGQDLCRRLFVGAVGTRFKQGRPQSKPSAPEVVGIGQPVLTEAVCIEKMPSA